MAQETAKTGVIVYEEKEQEPTKEVVDKEEQDKVFQITEELMEEGKKHAQEKK